MGVGVGWGGWGWGGGGVNQWNVTNICQVYIIGSEQKPVKQP